MMQETSFTTLKEIAVKKVMGKALDGLGIESPLAACGMTKAEVDYA